MVLIAGLRNSFGEVGIKRVGEKEADRLRKDQADGRSVLGSQSPRGSMRVVLIALDGFLHLPANIFSHIGGVVNNLDTVDRETPVSLAMSSRVSDGI